MNIKRFMSSTVRTPWTYSMALSVAALLNSNANAHRAIKSESKKFNIIKSLAKAVHKPVMPRIKGHVPNK